MELRAVFVHVELKPIVDQLSQLLEVDMGPGERVWSTPIGESVMTVLKRHDSGDLKGRDVHLRRLDNLLGLLSFVGEHDPELLAVYRRKLTVRNLGNFIGARCELLAAYKLIEAEVPFRRRAQGGPDFLCTKGFAGAGIECVSIHLQDETKGKFAVEKLNSAIRGKSEKDYAKPENALFVDMTNVMAASIDHATESLTSDDSIEAVMAANEDTPFGQIILSHSRYTLTDGRVTETGVRYRNLVTSTRTSELERLMDRVFPNLPHTTDEPLDWRVPYLP